jgi:hypothetical protein
MITIIKENWDPTSEMRRQYDQMLKDMMLAN